jgi:hypothetical protein
MALQIKPASKFTGKTLLALSRDNDKSLKHIIQFAQSLKGKVLVVTFGTPERFNDTGFDVVHVPDVNDIISTASEVEKVAGNYAVILVDSITLLRRKINATIAGDGSPSIQEYGIANNRLVNALALLQQSAKSFATTGAFVLDEDKTKKANGREVWELDFTSNLKASIFPHFGSIVYIANDDTVVTDRDLAINGKATAPKSAPRPASRPKTVKQK